MQFEHPYAQKAQVQDTLVDGGGLKAHTLVVTASITLRESDNYYDAAAVAQLQTAAVQYAKRCGCHTIDFLGLD